MHKLIDEHWIEVSRRVQLHHFRANTLPGANPEARSCEVLIAGIRSVSALVRNDHFDTKAYVFRRVRARVCLWNVRFARRSLGKRFAFSNTLMAGDLGDT